MPWVKLIYTYRNPVQQQCVARAINRLELQHPNGSDTGYDIENKHVSTSFDSQLYPDIPTTKWDSKNIYEPMK